MDKTHTTKMVIRKEERHFFHCLLMSNTTQDTRIKSTTPKNKQSAKATMKERLAIIMMQSNIINVASTAGGSHQYCSMNLFIEKSDSLNYKCT